jgi:hypothetical protein
MPELTDLEAEVLERAYASIRHAPSVSATTLADAAIKAADCTRESHPLVWQRLHQAAGEFLRRKFDPVQPP